MTEADSPLEHDPLTGLYSRRFGLDALGRLLTVARQTRGRLALVYADIDRMYDYNKVYGMTSGDELIRRLAAAFKASVGDAGLAFRFGGDEFIAVLPGLSAESAGLKAEEALRAARGVRYPDAPAGDAPNRVSLTLAVAAFPDNGAGVDGLFVAADEALSLGKGAGGGRVSIARTPDWADLEHAYGPAGDLPELLWRLSPDPDDEAWSELWSCICHQGTVYSASYPALPYLAEAAAEWPPSARVMPLCLAAAIVISDDAHGDRGVLTTTLAGTVERLRRLAAETLRAGGFTRVEFIYLLEAALALEGDVLWGRQLDRLADGEFEGVCPGCDTRLYLVVGQYGFFVTSEEWVNRPPARRNNVGPAGAAGLSGVGRWLHERAVEAGQPEVALWVRHLFGSTICPECERRLQVADAIARAGA